MTREGYSNLHDLDKFGFFVNALEGRSGDDGDRGRSFPRSDVEDLRSGARFIPGNVTLARREGTKINFVTKCGPNCWYWEMPDGSRIYHYDPITYQRIGIANNRKLVKNEDGDTHFEGGPGPCPHCGNVNTSGGTIKP